MKQTAKTVQIAQSVKALADELVRLASMISMEQTDDTQDIPAVPFVPAEKTPAETAAPSDVTVTLAEVRSCLAELSRAGYSDKVKELIRSHGAEKLSDIPESEYAALLAEAEVLKNGK